ncbi:TIGR03862 family flavoprotein [Rhizobium rhizogenes]|uniref:Aminoacetone oxidase family FAD-binding enzyme n=1 Tax=Rhizobium rhizogenes TaxID=359 RepID=A0AA92H9T8_RHIRH|nr:TIGR03862 family flavoprotein [Rhizobium rhizogenes]PVE55169.1 aminoacetone oxidase family FAD-binding enzyme [Rhizobium rhizogenes]PVE67723.1 aminoacetone oxidase family FAD-binding enzyme [Agrobacterium tumefaciens]PVE77500.1 aminoacetone oxidase family FAD-binding enzyme [Sphingomonas sp. TPD3009]
MQRKQIAIIGGGPAGLMAAEELSTSDMDVTVYEAMPTVARKFLMAGKSGLNITHGEDYARFTTRFGASEACLKSALDAFTPQMLRDWAEGLGQETFVGTSGRVFPKAMKGSPLLRAWLSRLTERGVAIKVRHRWVGLRNGALLFDTPDGQIEIKPDAVLLAFGGASWPRLGSTGEWVQGLREAGVDIADFQPANCGFDVAWSEHFRERFAGEPLKSVVTSSDAGRFEGEFVITRHGVEGALIYAHAAALRDSLRDARRTVLTIDLAPGRSEERIARDLARASSKDSFSNRLRKSVGLSPVKVALLRECASPQEMSASELARLIKAVPLAVSAPRPIAEAISSAGGIRWEGIDQNYMLKCLPGFFVAGEMLDWEATTGGYLLTACFATGKAAARGLLNRLTNIC